MNHTLRFLFFLLIVYPVMLVVIGLNVRRRHLLPSTGPAIVVANHNSHLDVMALLTLFGIRRLRIVRPVAAADFFLSNRWLAWFSTRIIGIIPLQRNVKGMRTDPLAGITQAIERGEILVLFPEGTRGEPERLEEFKNGVSHVAKRHPQVPIIPVFLHGLGKTLPRGEGLFVPFFCDVFIGEPFYWNGERDRFMQSLHERMRSLIAEAHLPEYG
jgi:1-acyl-sn-glycerol-3-phosphate acyltransferase